MSKLTSLGVFPVCWAPGGAGKAPIVAVLIVASRFVDKKCVNSEFSVSISKKGSDMYKSSLTSVVGTILEQYASYVSVTSLLLLVFATVCAVRWRRGNIIYFLMYWISVTLMVLVGRVYTISTAYGYDEGVHLAQALAVKQSGDFFGNVIIGTHGPISELLLLALSWIGLDIDYSWAHLLVVILQVVSGFLIYAVVARLRSSDFSMVAVLPYFAFLAFVLEPSFAAFSPESIANPIILSALLLVLCRRWRPSLGLVMAAGACLGLIPFVKTQFLPQAMAVGVIGFVVIYLSGVHRVRDCLVFVFSSAIPASGVLVLALFNPVIVESFVASFQYQNYYMTRGSWTTEVQYIWQLAGTSSAWWIVFAVFFPVCLSLYFLLFSRRLGIIFGADARESLDVLLLGTYLVSAVVGILAPGRPSLAYLLGCVPVIYLMHGYALCGVMVRFGREISIVIVVTTTLALAVPSVANKTLHSDIQKPQDVFTEGFLRKLYECTRRDRSMLLLNSPYCMLYVYSQVSSPIPKTFFLDYLSEHGDDMPLPDYKGAHVLLKNLQQYMPPVLVDIHRSSLMDDKQQRYDVVSSFIEDNYTKVFSENAYGREHVIWSRNEKSLDLFDKWLPCSVSLKGFGGVEEHGTDRYKFMWLVAREGSFTFPAAEGDATVSLTLFSPLFDEQVDVVFNDVFIGTLSLPKSNNVAGSKQVTLSFKAQHGENSLVLKPRMVNEPPHMEIPGDSRLLSVQLLAFRVALSSD